MTTTTDTALEALLARIDQLEARVAVLEGARGGGRRSGAGAGGPGGELDARSWTREYEIARLDASETWIELHEASARPQLQRLIREVVDAEGPVTDRLVLDRVRRAWGLKRAGGRVQEAFDQAVRQLVARALVERDADALRAPGTQLDQVRVPGDDDATRRGAEDVPIVELALAIAQAASHGGASHVDELTMQVAKLFGWTRRGGAIQERLDAALRHAVDHGMVRLAGSTVTAA